MSEVMDDLDKMNGAGSEAGGVGFDFADEPDTGEGEATVGSAPIPKSDFFVVTVAAVDARMQPESFEKPELEGIVNFRVDKGIEDTEGRLIRGTVVLAVPTTKAVREGDKFVQGQLTPEEQVKAKDTFIKTLTRMQRVLGLGSRQPASRSVEAVKAWLAPAVGKQAVITAGTNKKGFSYVVFGNMRAPGDPAPDPKKQGATLAGVTAQQQAEQEIAAYNTKKASGGKRGASAGGRAPAQPSDFS